MTSGVAALPPGPRLPALAQGLWFTLRPVDYFEICRRRYGDPFTVRLPSTPPVVMFSEPSAIRDIFTGDEDVLRAGEPPPSCGRSSARTRCCSSTARGTSASGA